MAPKLDIIICSTRPGRQGPKIAAWFDSFAREHGGFDANLVDLADFNLPIFDEPKHPRMRDYQHEHTKRWSAEIDSADAFVFVTPEYNYFAPPAMVNAVNYLSAEWAYKPASFVSYGGVSAGLRAQQAEKLMLTTLRIMPIPESVPIPFFPTFIGEDGVFKPNDIVRDGARLMLDELLRWTVALTPMRAKAA